MMSTIVVGYIPSPEREAALDRSIKEATAHKAKLVAVNIVHDDGSTIDDRYVPAEVTQNLRTRLEKTELDFEMIRTESPNVAETILEIAHERDAETIVL